MKSIRAHMRAASFKHPAARAGIFGMGVVLSIVILTLVSPMTSGRIFYLPILETYESAMLTVAPSGQRAFEYGERHFSATQTATYDLPVAEVFFRKALALDPSLPNVHHQLARVYFIQNDFGDAMYEIDQQISAHGTTTPNSYYVRGLIEGYGGMYAAAVEDYEHFLKFYPNDWAAVNDYAWVLMKAGRYTDAARVTAAQLKYAPTNAWLLNSNAIALYESGDIAAAQAPAHAAAMAAAQLTQGAWLRAYPGNDPQVASDGLAAFRSAAISNMHKIDIALATSKVQ